MNRLKRSWVFMLITMLAVNFSSQAQLKALMDAGAKAKEKFKPMGKETVDLSAQKFQPAVGLESLLSHIDYTKEGKFHLKTFKIYFLPDKNKKGKKIDYNPRERTGYKISVDLVDALSNQVVETFMYMNQQVINPASDAMLAGCRDCPQEVNIKDGEYRLDFKIANQLFYQFPFTVVKAENDDPYATMSDMYFLDGDWKNLSFLLWSTTSDRRERPVVNFYYLNDDLEFKAQYHTDDKFVDTQIKLERDGKVVAYNKLTGYDKDKSKSYQPERREYGLKHAKWNHIYSQMYQYPKPLDEKGVPVVGQQFLHKDNLKDGHYTLTIDLKDWRGKEDQRVFHFDMVNNEVVLNKLQDRRQNDDVTHLWEGRDEIFLPKENM